MNRKITLLMTLGLATTFQAVAATPPSQAVQNRRDLVSCMTRQMSASRTLSYNDATKLCKQQQKAANANTALAGTPKVADAR